MSVIKYKRLTRLDPNSPPLKSWWAINGFSELFGTFIIAFALSGLSIIAVNKDPIEYMFGHPIFVGFLEGFVIKGLLILLLIRWSVDINPAVTMYKILVGYNTVGYGMFKIGIQLFAGFMAGVLTWVIGSNAGYAGMINEAITSERITASFFNNGDGRSIASGALFLFAAELVLTMIYLLPIFSKGIHNEWRDLFLMLILSMNTFLGLAAGIGAGASNPARALAIQTPGLLEGGVNVFYTHVPSVSHHVEGTTAGFYSATFAMLAAGFTAPLMFAFIQDVLIKWVNPFLHTAMRYKNGRVARISRDLSSTSAKYNESIAKFRSHKKARLTDRDPRYDEWVNE